MATEAPSETNGHSKDDGLDSLLIDYLEGKLQLPEQEAFEIVAAHNPEMGKTILVYSTLLEEISNAIEGLSKPSPQLRERIMAIAGTSPISQVIRASEGIWMDSPFPGIRFKLLFQDPDTKKMTVLGRIAAGSRMPPHRHIGLEECLVLEGNLWTDGEFLEAGDYIVTQDQTVHTDTWSPDGALVMLKTYFLDELVTV